MYTVEIYKQGQVRKDKKKKQEKNTNVYFLIKRKQNNKLPVERMLVGGC